MISQPQLKVIDDFEIYQDQNMILEHLTELYKVRDAKIYEELAENLGGWDWDNWTVPRLYAMTFGGYEDLFEEGWESR